ncbi:MAG: helix-turn-helix domain-containing protein [Pseudobutyrivibrio sp.]|nr:helix-turn-helix domain-containing protein [Pseudobutyrivibrio sp.]
MDFNEKKSKLLEQLNNATGINFEISDSDLSDEETVNKLKEILVHFNGIDSKNSFYKLFLTGELSYADAAPSLHRYHIEENGIRHIFYLESQQEYKKDVISLLKSLLLDSKDVVIEMDSRHLLVVINFAFDPTQEDLNQAANSYLDMLESETYISFKLSYSNTVTSFKDLQEAYKTSVLAMKIGNIFNANGRIYCYDELGLDRLLYNIPLEEAKSYLDRHINFDILSQIDEETLNLLDSFFANDLSLAETSRKMFIHRNTLIYRLDKFTDLTGYDVRKFSDAITVKISLMLYNYIRLSK